MRLLHRMRPDRIQRQWRLRSKTLLNSLGRLMIAEDLWVAFWEVFSETTNPCLRPTKLKGAGATVFESMLRAKLLP